MIRNRKNIIRFCIPFLLVTFLFSIACKKKQEEVLPPDPVLELIEVTPDSIQQFRDSVVVRIKYKDNDGDLGDESPDVYSMLVKDDRLNAPDHYHVSPLAPLGTTLKIEGELKVKLNGMFLIGNGKTETTLLKIKIQDRAGHWSNELVTPKIVIKDTL
jgi:hypothetical protein